MACVRTIDAAGVVATVNDQGTAGQADVSEAMATAKIPRVASNVVQDDWADPNAYPIDASGTGVTFLMPQALIDEGSTRSASSASTSRRLRPGRPPRGVYEGDATFPYDAPVPGGTTDYNQFILGAQNAGADGLRPLGEQEAIQVVKAGQQLETDLNIGSTWVVLAQERRRLGDFTKHMAFLVVPAGDDRPPRVQGAAGRPRGVGRGAAPAREPQGEPDAVVDRALRADQDDPRRQDDRRYPRGHHHDAQQAKDVPMLDMFGGENWTPNWTTPALQAGRKDHGRLRVGSRREVRRVQVTSSRSRSQLRQGLCVLRSRLLSVVADC